MDFKKKTVEKKSGNRKRTIVLIAVAYVLGISCAGYYYFKRPVSPPVENSSDAVKYMASAEFKKLSADERKAYFKGVNEQLGEGRGAFFKEASSLSENERKQLRENTGSIFRSMMNERVNKYFALPKEERSAYLDKMIDEMEKRRKDGPPPGSPPGENKDGKNDRRGDKGGPSVERMKKHIEGTSSSDRAKNIQFMMDMRARMQERKG
ncbi:MAG: hypothetical protein A2017_17150 [Lentisphaerae bacterium GWF2_44_16]|nr:MAG: hypothetical protein A2017_17150 [Lentisphaerae bacterium GWF2_44_16]